MIAELVRVLDPSNSTDDWQRRWAARGIPVEDAWPVMVDAAFRTARRTWRADFDDTDSRIREALVTQVARWHRFGCPGCDDCPAPPSEPLEVGGLIEWMRQRATDAWRKEHRPREVVLSYFAPSDDRNEPLEQVAARLAGDTVTVTSDGYAAGLPSSGGKPLPLIYGREVEARHRALAALARLDRNLLTMISGGYSLAEVRELMPEPRPSLKSMQQRITRARKAARAAAVYEPLIHGRWPALSAGNDCRGGIWVRDDDDAHLLDGVRIELSGEELQKILDENVEFRDSACV